MITKNTRPSRDIAEVYVHINNVNITLKNDVFGGNEPINIFDLLTPFDNETDMLNISETQEFIALPTFLVYHAENQFSTNLSRASRHCEIT